MLLEGALEPEHGLVVFAEGGIHHREVVGRDILSASKGPQPIDNGQCFGFLAHARVSVATKGQ